MRKFARSLAVIMAFAMAGSTVCAGSGAYGSAQRVYAAEVQNQEGQEEPVAEAQNQDDQEESVAELAAASGLGVAKHSKSDIIAQIKKNGAYPSDAVTYKKAYKTKSPYYEGALSDATLKKALATLNNVRYIAGLNYNVTLDSTYTAQCQAGAYVDYLIDDLRHDPRKPSGMSDALYKKGYAGCSSSNIAMGSSTLNSCILYSWMYDSDSSNIRYVGHRGWCLNPTMGKTGFGVAGIYMSMYALDMSNNSSIKNVAWPAQTMPLEYFGNDYAWSLFTGQNETESRVKVTLKRKSDGRTWTFSKGKANGDFYVSNDYQKGAIVFRPKGITEYKAGDVFTVSVTGVSTPVTYTVSFFSLGDASHNHKLKLSATPNFNTMKATVVGKCNECNKSYKATANIKITTSGVSCGYKGIVSYSYSGVILNGKKYNGTGKAKVTSLPHMYGKPTFQWSGKSCTASRLCSRCKKTSKTACKVTSKSTATCTAAGQTTYTATYGSYSSTKKVAAAKLAHKFTKYTSDKNATCTKDGTKTAKCDYGCGTKKTVTDTGTKLAHKYTKYTSDKNATCMKDGTKTAKCDYGCGAKKTVTEPGTKLAHKYTKYVSNNDATCTKDGTKTAKCDYGCGAVDTVIDKGSKILHVYTKYVSNGDATCTADGTKTAKCDYGCGAVDTVIDKGSKIPHVYTNYVSNGDATCTADGTKTAKCDYGCGAVDTVIDTGSKIPHVYTKYVPNDDATCTADGTKTAHCDYGCGATDTVTDEGSMIPHVYTNYVSNGDATCMADGTKTAHCDYGCGATDTVTDRGSRLPHVFVNYVSNEDATCTADGTKTAYCDYGCGTTDTLIDEGTRIPHVYTNYVSNEDATCTADGTKTAHCDYGCGTTDTVTDEGTKIPHVFTDYVSNGDATCTADGTKTALCDYGCGAADTITDKGSMLPHSLTDERIVTKKARVHSDGVVSGRCSECGKIIPTGKIAAIDKVVTNNSRMLYDGSEKTASVTAYDTDGEQIPRSQYILSYDDNISSGIVHVTMTFRGDYEGTLKGSFRIYPMSTSVRSVTNVYGGMKLTWNKVPDGTGYVIYRNVNGGAYKRIKRISGIGLTTYTDTVARVNGNRYAYKIYVYRKSGDVTLFSTASSPKAAYHMAAPVIKQTSNLSSGSLKITYTRNSKATGYQIQYADNAKFSGAKAVGVTGYNNLSKTITGLQKKTYYVRIRSFKKSGGVVSYSNWSSAKSVSVRK